MGKKKIETETEEEQQQPQLRGVLHNGTSAMVGVPARDLSLAEIVGLGLDLESLVASGLYKHDYSTPEIAPEEEEEEETQTQAE
jgi:hypothetical protein